MPDLAKLYSNAIHNNLKAYFGNWMPYDIVEIGDYGVLIGSQFNKYGNLRDLNISFSIQASRIPGTIEYSSSDLTTATSENSIDSTVEYKMKFEFEGGIFFCLKDINSIRIVNEQNLCKWIKQHIDKIGDFKREYVIVTGIEEATFLKLIINQGKDAEISFKLNPDNIGNTPVDYLSDNSIVRSSKIGFKYLTNRGNQTPIRPLIKLSNIRKYDKWNLLNIFKLNQSKNIAINVANDNNNMVINLGNLLFQHEDMDTFKQDLLLCDESGDMLQPIEDENDTHFFENELENETKEIDTLNIDLHKYREYILTEIDKKLLSSGFMKDDKNALKRAKIEIYDNVVKRINELVNENKKDENIENINS